MSNSERALYSETLYSSQPRLWHELTGYQNHLRIAEYKEGWFKASVTIPSKDLDNFLLSLRMPVNFPSDSYPVENYPGSYRIEWKAKEGISITDYPRHSDSVTIFIEWNKQKELIEKVTAFYLLLKKQPEETPLNHYYSDVISYITELAEFGFTRTHVPGYTDQYTIVLTNPNTQEQYDLCTIEDIHRAVIDQRAKDLDLPREEVAELTTEVYVKYDSKQRQSQKPN